MNAIITSISNVFNNSKHSNGLLVAVHDGVFHADEVSAWAVIGEWCHATGRHGFKLTRTRNDDDLALADVILDVSPRNCEAENTYDHHRHPEWVREDGTPYATAGLMWAALGPQIALDYGIDETMPEIQKAFVEAVDNVVFMGIDAADCGKASPCGQPTLSAMISSFNAENVAERQPQIFAFMAASKWFADALRAVCRSTASRLLKQAAAEAALMPQAGNNVLVLEKMVPWKEIVLEHWDAFQNSQVIVYPDVAAPGTWRIQTLPGALDDPFAMRCPAPKELWGKRDGYLGGQPLVFVHQGGFIGGVKAATAAEAVKAAEAWIAGSQA